MRIYTFFMYLSDVDEGGGTRFADLNITVPAVKGTAVVWPSVTSADPSKTGRTQITRVATGQRGEICGQRLDP